MRLGAVIGVRPQRQECFGVALEEDGHRSFVVTLRRSGRYYRTGARQAESITQVVHDIATGEDQYAFVADAGERTRGAQLLWGPQNSALSRLVEIIVHSWQRRRADAQGR